MLDILFTHSYFYKFDPKQWNNKTPYPPLGTIYAASYLRNLGNTVDLFDANLLDGPEQIIKEIKQKRPKFLVVYDDCFNYLTKMCLTNMREAAFKMIKIAKENGCFVICCSSDATDHAEKYINNGADVIIKGEGELVLEQLVKAVKKGEDYTAIESIVFKKDGILQSNPVKKVLKILDELPQPAWDLVNVDAYKEVWRQGGKECTLNMVTTRGCPYKCNWCAKPIYGNRYNSHSPEYVVNHIQYLVEEFKVNKFWMCDDIFGLKPNWVQEFDKLLKERNLKISYFIQSRVDLLLKEDNIAALASSGLEEVWLGAESGSQKILDAMDKGITIAQIEEATKKLKSHNIKVAYFIQFGYLGETKEDIFKTIAMVKNLLPDSIGVSVSYPLPGTKFYEKVKDDLKLKANWTDSDDLEMLFKGTFNADYYRKLQRYIHKEHRKALSVYFIKKLHFWNKKNLRRVLLLPYYTISSWFVLNQLQQMQHINEK